MSSDDRMPQVGKLDGTSVTGVALIAGLLVLLASAACGGASSNSNLGSGGGGGPSAAKVVGTIAVGTTPNAVAVDPATNTIYVANFGQEGNDGICATCYCPWVNGTLTTIDGVTQSVATNALPPAGAQYPYENPLDLAVNPATHTVYVAARLLAQPTLTCYYFGGLQLFNSGTLAQTVTDNPSHGASFPENVAVNEKTGNVYWTDWEGSSLAVVDASGNLLTTISLPARPVGIAVNATTNKIYAATTYPITGVIVIDGSTNAVIDTITNLSWPEGIAVNASANAIYVANSGGCSSSSPYCNSLAIIDGATDSVKANIPAGTGAAAVAFDPQTNFIYVANVGNYDFNQAGSVTVIDAGTNATTTLTDPDLTYPYRIAVNPTTNKIYVLNELSNNVTVIDGAHD